MNKIKNIYPNLIYYLQSNIQLAKLPMKKYLSNEIILRSILSSVIALTCICIPLSTDALSQDGEISTNPEQAFTDWINTKNYLDRFCGMGSNTQFNHLVVAIQKKYWDILGDKKTVEIAIGQTVKFNMGQVRPPSDKSKLISNCSALIQVAKIYAESIGYNTNFLSEVEQNLVNQR